MEEIASAHAVSIRVGRIDFTPQQTVAKIIRGEFDPNQNLCALTRLRAHATQSALIAAMHISHHQSDYSTKVVQLASEIIGSQ